MRERETCFYSEGLKLDASFFMPDHAEVRPQLCVVCSGFMGLKSIHPARFARALTPRGYPCFGFDYRGFARSEGVPGRVLVEEQIRDIANALAFVSSQPEAEGRSILLIGWGMGAGLILEATRLAPPVAGLVSINGFYDAVRVQRALRGDAGWQAFCNRLLEMRIEGVASGKPHAIDPFAIYPLDPVTTGYVDGVLRQNADFGGMVDPVFADSLLEFAPERRLSHLGSVPILIAHGDRNELHPPAEAISLHECYPGPKELYWIGNAGHTEWMLDENPLFQALVDRIDHWARALS